MQRINTLAFIEANPTDLVLIPQTSTRTGTGTHWTPGTARASQRVRLIDQSKPTGPTEGTVQGADGVQQVLRYQLLLPWDGLVDVADYRYDAGGIRWDVEDVMPYNGYERRAEVARYGEASE